MLQKKLNHHISLGIANLPHELDQLIIGGIYCVSCNDISTYFRLLLQSILENLHNKKKCTLISILDKNKFIQLARSFDLEITPFLHNKQLTIYHLPPNSKTEMLHDAPEQLLIKLDRAKIYQSDYILFDAVTDLLFWHNPQAAAEKIAVYKAWLNQHKTTALISFVAEKLPPANHADQLNGIMHITTINQAEKAQIGYWQTQHHRTTAITCIMSSKIDSTATLIKTPISNQTANNVIPLFPAKSQQRQLANPTSPPIYYLGKQYNDWQTIHRGMWEQIDSFATLRQKAINPAPQLIVFSISSYRELFQVAKTVIVLRKRAHAKSNIVIREVNYALRYSDTKLLESCGVNQVIPQNMPVSRIKLALDMLKHTHQSNSPTHKSYKLLLSFNPPNIRGFLNEADFRRYVLDKMPQLDNMTLPFVFAKSTLLFEAAIREENLANAKTYLRKGDIVTTIKNEIWLFLIDCEPNNITKVITRLHHNALTWIKDISVSSNTNDIQTYLKKTAKEKHQKIS